MGNTYSLSVKRMIDYSAFITRREPTSDSLRRYRAFRGRTRLLKRADGLHGDV